MRFDVGLGTAGKASWGSRNGSGEVLLPSLRLRHAHPDIATTTFARCIADEIHNSRAGPV